MKTIIVETDGIDLQPVCGNEYFIEWERCSTKDAIVEWILHLTEDLVFDRNDPRLHSSGL
jgi:hypothetical protein